jgi:hypothetical protein
LVLITVMLNLLFEPGCDERGFGTA